MKQYLSAVFLAMLISVTSCTENYQSSIDFGDNTYINDYSELANAINDLTKTLDERLLALNQLLESNLVAIKVSIDAQTNAITAQTTALEEGLGNLNASLIEGFAALKVSIDNQGDKTVSALNKNGELISLHIDQAGELIAAELKATTASLIDCLNANTTTLAGKLDNINSKLGAVNQAISDGFILIQGEQVTANGNLANLDASIQALITQVAASAQSILTGITTLQATLDTQLNTLTLSVDGVKTEIIQLSAGQVAALTALQEEVESQGGKLEYAILNDESVVVNALGALGNVLKSELISLTQSLTTQTSTLKQAIEANTSAMANALGLTTTELQNLIRAINTNDAAALEEMRRQNATLAFLLSYSDGITVNGEPDANQQYASINVTTSVWYEATNNTEVMKVINNLMAPQGAPEPTKTQYASYSSGDTYYYEGDIHLHSVWTRIQDNNVVTAKSGSVTQNNVTMITLKRVYETSNFSVYITSGCNRRHIYSIKITDAEHATDYECYDDKSGSGETTSTNPIEVTFKNYNSSTDTYCPNPTVKVYSN